MSETMHGPEESRDPAVARDVFISYASLDVAIATAAVTALERHGLTCWIAPRDVMPGSLYADGIVRAINAAKVFVLLLSEHALASAHVGKEIERASSKRRPIIALRTDQAPLTPAFEYFLSESQWIDVGAGGLDGAAARLVDAVRRLIDSPSGAKPGGVVATGVAATRGWNRPVVAVIAVVAVAAAALVLFRANRSWLSKPGAAALADSAAPSASAGSAEAFAPPPHSIAVLPFVNMSGDPKQDYFSDGLSEELLNSLSTVRDLQVAARTSSFSFKGKDANVADIARKLNVGDVLEGSVRKDGNQVRITAQLINALTGFHLWSQTYDRNLRNILALQTEIASAVTKALQATLMADAVASIEIGGTQNPAAFDAYLHGKSLDRGNFDKDNTLARVATYSQAARLDPGFAKAWVGAATAQNMYAKNFATDAEIHSWFQQARASAEKALALAPELGEAHATVAYVLEGGFLEFARAQAEYERALALAPNDAAVLLLSGVYFVETGRPEAGLSNLRRAIALDQLNPEAYGRLSIGLFYAHRYRQSIDAAERALQFNANDTAIKNFRGLNYLMLGDLDSARLSCATEKRTWEGRLCLAIVYDKLHQQREAEAELAAMKAELGNSSAYQYAEIYAQWGDTARALDWLDVAYRLPDPGISTLKVDGLIDPLRKEPRLQQIERELKFPQ